LTHRFFIPPPCITPPTVTLPADVARQIKTVLRMQPGDEVVVLDGSGSEWRVRLSEVGKNVVLGEIIARQPAAGEPEISLTLYQGALKAQKFEWVLQKGVELGISRFTPTLCHRSVANDAGALTKKQARWQRIIREAAEQSGRGKLPQLAAPTPFDQALQQSQPDTLIVMPWEAAADEANSLKEILTAGPVTDVAIFIGPEGGFTPDEAALAQEAGAHLVKLGPRILRAETAGLAVCAAILYELGEWK
jgi:16S rRNA (uracil1498-N3)-methyltransferase